MPKTRRKKRKKRPSPNPQSQTIKTHISLDDSFFMFLIGVTGTFTLAISNYLLGFKVQKQEVLVALPSWLLITCKFIALTAMAAAIIAFSRFIRHRRGKWIFIPQTKKQAVFILSMCFFNLIVTAILLLYAYGYIARLSLWLQSWLPTKKISKNATLGMIFIAGAVVSGVVGNFAYDLLKLAVKKTISTKS